MRRRRKSSAVQTWLAENEIHTNVLRFDVGMNQVTLIMKILKAKKDLLCNDLHEGLRDTFLLVALNQREEGFSERFEYNTHVSILRTTMIKRVEEGDDIRSTRMTRICSSYLRKEFDFVAGCLNITSSRFDDFEGGVAVLTEENHCEDEDL
jgi:hypothetical protein